jgi:6-phosphofructokinase 1
MYHSVSAYRFIAIALQVHGAFAGYSGISVGICNTHYAYFPIPEVILHPRLVDPNSRMWHRCLTSTGQPDFI